MKVHAVRRTNNQSIPIYASSVLKLTPLKTFGNNQFFNENNHIQSWVSSDSIESPAKVGPCPTSPRHPLTFLTTSPKLDICVETELTTGHAVIVCKRCRESLIGERK